MAGDQGGSEQGVAAPAARAGEEEDAYPPPGLGLFVVAAPPVVDQRTRVESPGIGEHPDSSTVAFLERVQLALCARESVDNAPSDVLAVTAGGIFPSP